MSRIPAVDYLVLGDTPHLRARRCRACGALYLGRRNACARCFHTEFDTQALANTGRVRAFTVVHRSVPQPYASAIVELDGGGFVKANLVGVVDPDRITDQLDVELETFSVGTDDDGVEAVAFGYRPRDGENDRGAQ